MLEGRQHRQKVAITVSQAKTFRNKIFITKCWSFWTEGVFAVKCTESLEKPLKFLRNIGLKDRIFSLLWFVLGQVSNKKHCPKRRVSAGYPCRHSGDCPGGRPWPKASVRPSQPWRTRISGANIYDPKAWMSTSVTPGVFEKYR